MSLIKLKKEEMEAQVCFNKFIFGHMLNEIVRMLFICMYDLANTFSVRYECWGTKVIVSFGRLRYQNLGVLI